MQLNIISILVLSLLTTKKINNFQVIFVNAECFLCKHKQLPVPKNG